MIHEQVVISGIAGKFAQSDNVKDLQRNLFNKVDCVTDASPRWIINNPYIPSRIGISNDVTKMDNVFFGTHSKYVPHMEPMTRILVERVYEAIVDAGINPSSLKGSRTGVFTGASYSESEKNIFYEKVEQNGFLITGLSRTMIANRVSFFFGLVGPSINLDSACTSSCTALEHAYQAIISGQCENAIVGGSNLVLHPQLSVQMNYVGLLSMDGKTKSFDNNADGYARSESTVAIFIQRARDAKRIYAEIMNVKSLHGPSTDVNTILFPKSDFQAAVMKQALDESGLSPKDISFIEADGQGIKEADADEARAIDSVFNRNLDSPLLIGSVKSNIGHTSASSTLNSIIKVIAMMETGFIPPNLHHTIPSEKIPALAEGRLKVVTETTPWNGNFAAINSTSYVGNFSNIILKAHKKEKKNNGQPEDNLPRLVMVSGRTEDAVNTILSDLESRPVDTEMLQLIHEVFDKQTPSHLYRGFTILPPRGIPQSQERQIEFVDGKKREIWYIFSGMGSQWVGMGEDLMRLPVFANTVKKCDAVLKPRGIDINYILTDKNPEIFDNVVNSFVGIATVQIGLVDLLKSVGIEPDFMIGHSVGELGCAYADGCFTAEEMVLSALSRGLASVESDLQEGLMAAVGLGYEKIKLLCPSDIDIACRNSDDSSTISGPPESVKKFVTKLKAKGIFAKEVASSNIAYHSRYIAPAGNKLLDYLQEVIPNPRSRSDRWISTSVPESEWKVGKAPLSSAEYHTNNLLSPVLFDEASKLIPANAIAIEIAPHGLLQAILKKSLPKECTNIPLTKRGHKDNVEFLLSAFGKLYLAGLQPQVNQFYPRVEFPVGRGTSSISPLIKWEHSNDWAVQFYSELKKRSPGEQIYGIALDKQEWKFLKGNKINGKIITPVSIYLKLLWGVLRVIHSKKEISVVFEDVEIHESFVEVKKDETLTLTIMIHKGSGKFEIVAHTILVATGRARILEEDEQDSQSAFEEFTNESIELDENDVYTELNMRGYQYSGCFRSIRKCSINRDKGILFWQDEWITFLDGIIQMYILKNDIRKLQLPLKLRKVVIDIEKHQDIISKSKEVPVFIDSQLDHIRSGGVEFTGITLETILPESSDNELKYETVKFVPGNNDVKFIPLSSHPRIVSNWRASQIRPGEVNSITWVQLPVVDNTELEKLVKVEYAGLNHSDIYLVQRKSFIEATKRHKPETQRLGLEYSGINSKGTRVMGIAKNTLSRYTHPDPEFTWSVPDSWTLEDAATVPVAYTAAYAAVCLEGGVKNGKSILILNGGSSIGQAAINIALENKCKVFTTYETIDEKKFLCSQYPDIDENQVCSNRKFEDHILRVTQGQGVDVIIHNDSNLYNLEESLRCIKTSCKVIVVGELDGAFHEFVGMAVFLKQVSISSIVVSKLVNADINTKKVLASMVAKGIADKIVKPLPRRAYKMEMMSSAFVDSSSSKSYRKVIVRVQPESLSEKQVLAKPQINCTSSKVYIVIEGITNFGFEVVNFLITRGARNIIISSCTQINESSFYKLRRKLWESYGVNLIIRENLDLSKKQNVKALMNEATLIGSVDAIFDLQRMRSSLLRSNEITKYVNTFTKYLDEESREFCPNLSHFVICSAVMNPNDDFKEFVSRECEVAELCDSRIKNGFPGLLILWGPINGISECSNLEKENNLLSIPQCINQLDEIIGFDSSIVIISKKMKIVGNEKIENQDSVPAKPILAEKKAFEAYIFHTDETLRSEL